MTFPERIFFLDDAEADEILQVHDTGTGFQPRFRRNLTDFRTPRRDGLDNGIIRSRLTHFLLQEVERFLEEISHRVQEILHDIFINRRVAAHLPQIERNPAGQPIEDGQFLRFHIGKKLLGFKNRERLQFQLSRPAPKKGALMTQDLFFHKTHGRTTKNQINIPVLPDMIDLDLKQ